MATSLDSSMGPDRTEMEKFGNVGMALLPWTRQILCVMWEHLRFLVHVIYYSFLSVFQMFRFEVHVRITDETGQHVQHMSSSTDHTDSFFSSLFDGDKGVLSGGTNPLSNFCADVGDPFPVRSHAEAILSSLCAEDLCCGLVDDFVSRATDNEDGLFLGHHSSWKMGFPSDWNIFLSSTDSSGTDETSQKSTDKFFDCKQEVSEEEKGVCEEDQKFEKDDSTTLWESLSKSSDPYNPLVFSASIKTTSNMGKKQTIKSELECIKPSKANEGPYGLNFWASRSDSESSWGSSDGSCADVDKEESDRLWEFLSSPVDPYNPMCFTACSISSMPKTSIVPRRSREPQQASFCSKSDTDTEEKSSSSCGPASSEDDEEEQLWNSLCQNDDPYHPLNFQACLQSSPTTTELSKHQTGDLVTPLNHLTQCQPSQKTVWTWNPHQTRSTKPTLPKRHSKTHCHPATTVVPWIKQTESPGTDGAKETNNTSPQKKVRFSPVVKMHVMRTWSFARQASRHGTWEEIARDRDRFQRRIRDTQQAISYCFSQSHREKIQANLAID